MFTVLLALINAKYKTDYIGLFLTTAIIDIVMWVSLGQMFR